MSDEDRFYIDERVGCIAVRDREKDHERENGLHGDMDGVLALWRGHNDADLGWRLADWQREKAMDLRELLRGND